jgi:superfamily I DNA/RNA helicase
VARLYLAKDFLPEYARLDKQVQSAVEAAIGKFADAVPGLRLEKLTQARDHRIRTIRIDAAWRGVVLAPESGDIYCLLTVMRHDDAIRYATTRRFSVNEAVGLLEVRDEEALEPLAGHALKPADGGTADLLFARVSDADLKRLGVDEAVIRVVRPLAAEDHLEALQPFLPEVQYTALYALACGMTVEEAWAQVCQYLPAQTSLPPRVDPANLVLAMERTPGLVTPVSGPAALRQILAYPFAAWRTFLHPAQRAIAYQDSYAGPALVTGGAGTGKTVAAVHRAAFLAQRAAPPAPGSPDRPPILLTTFTTSLADALGAQLAVLVGDERVRARVEILNVDKLANRIVRAARGTLAIADPDAVQARFALAAAEARLGLTASFLINEWEQVILALDLGTEQAYLDCERAGRGRPLAKAQRHGVWQAVQRVAAELEAAGEFTYAQITCEAARRLTESSRPPYRHVIVDEGQDLSAAQWRLLRAAVAPGPDDLFIAADPHQRIYDNRVSLASLGINVRGRSRRLRVNYRTTAEILTWAVPILGTAKVTGLDDDLASLLGYRSPTHGARPDLRAAVSRDDELAALAARVRGWLEAGIEPHAIGVAARSSAVAAQARDELKAAGIKTLALATQSSTSAVRVGTMHRMKGLEFQAVAVIGVEDSAVPADSALTPAAEDSVAREQDLQRERCVLFVACTRARDHLYVSWTGQPSRFLAD